MEGRSMGSLGLLHTEAGHCRLLLWAMFDGVRSLHGRILLLAQLLLVAEGALKVA